MEPGVIDRLLKVLAGEEQIKTEVTINQASLIMAMIIIVLTASLLMLINIQLKKTK